MKASLDTGFDIEEDAKWAWYSALACALHAVDGVREAAARPVPAAAPSCAGARTVR